MTSTIALIEPPDRICVAQDSDGFWTCREAVIGSQEYVRSDIERDWRYEALRLKTELTTLLERCEKAEARVAEWEVVADKLQTQIFRYDERLDVAEAQVKELAAERDDYKAAYEDTRRLAREIDVAMHGEDGAAKQASLCDLVHPASLMRAQVKELREALEKLRTDYAVGEEYEWGLWCRRNIEAFWKDQDAARALKEGE